MATVLMDITGTVFWQRFMDPATQKKEREVEPRFPLVVLAERIARRLGFASPEQAAEPISNVLHWGVGIVCGALHGVIEEPVSLERRSFGLPVVSGMVAVDEFALPAAGLCPWPAAFPWKTHARGLTSHVAYALSMAVFYEGLKCYLLRAI